MMACLQDQIGKILFNPDFRYVGVGFSKGEKYPYVYSKDRQIVVALLIDDDVP